MAETTTETTATAVVEAPKTETPTAAATKPETAKPETKADWVQDFLASPKAAETTTEAKPDQKADAAVEPKDNGTPKAEKKAEKPAKAEPVLSGVEKQLKDTRDYATRVNQQNLKLESDLGALRQQMETLAKKMDGTYEEPKTPSSDEVRRETSLVTRVNVSMDAAIEHYGQEEVARLITGESAPWKELEKDPAVNARVFASRLPVFEAIKVVQEHEARQKYGGDLSTMQKTIKEEMTKELRESIRAELLKELRGKGDEEVKGLSGVPSGGRTEAKTGATTPEQRFHSLFPNFARPPG